MDPLTTSALISAGGNFLGGLFGSSSAKKAAKRMEELDNTKHQRNVQDLEKAGLNKLLSVTNGVQGAPSGALDISGQLLAQSAAGAVNSALDAKRTDSQTDLNKIMEGKVLADTAASTSAAGLNRSLAAQAQANTVNTNLDSAGKAVKNKIDTVKGKGLDKVIDTGGGVIDNIKDWWNSNSAKTPTPPKLPNFQLRPDSQRLKPYLKH